MPTKPKKSKKKPVNNRTKQGKFKKGMSGNPNGRPVGSGSGLSITALVKAELEKCPEGENKKTYADLVVKRTSKSFKF